LALGINREDIIMMQTVWEYFVYVGYGPFWCALYYPLTTCVVVCSLTAAAIWVEG
jgi:hypothetical protein